MPSLLILLAAMAALIAARRRRQHRPASSVIVSPRKSTMISGDGAVHSVQTAELTAWPDDVDRLWNATNLENLGRTYWRFLARVTLGLIRVVYGVNERRVVFLGRPWTLLRFAAPQYTLQGDHGQIRWPIRDGLLVARAGRGSGYLAIDVRRRENPDPGAPVNLRIEVAVRNFYPAIAAEFSRPVYEVTQNVIHVLVTHAFLRSLAKLDLAQSKVGRLATPSG